MNKADKAKQPPGGSAGLKGAQPGALQPGTPLKGKPKAPEVRNGKAGKNAPPAPQPGSSSPFAGLPGVKRVRVKSRAPVTVPRSSEPNYDLLLGERLARLIPSYADEVGAALLIGLGLLSFLTLMSPGVGRLSTAWSQMLGGAFGLGAFLISALVMLAGGLLLATKLGVRVRLNWWRIGAGEVFFVLLLAYIHAMIRFAAPPEVAQVEALAQALEGRGGGLVGWAIQEMLFLALGQGITGAVLLLGLTLSGGAALGLRKTHLVNLLARVQAYFEGLAARWAPPASAPEPTEDDASFSAAYMPEDAAFDADYYTLTGEAEAAQAPLSAAAMYARPSILQSEAEAAPPEDREAMIERLASEGAILQRFTLQEMPDKKKLAKRDENLPPLEILEAREYFRPTDEEINFNAQVIEETVGDFGMRVEVMDVKAGPTVTQYAVQPFAKVEKDGKKVVQRVRVTRVAALAKDLALALSASTVRIQAPVPGTNYIGVEVPNKLPGIVSLRPVIESLQFFKIRSASPLAVALGREVDGKPFAIDLATMPHMLIGGTTGSGKSVCLRSLVTCLVANNDPDTLRVILLDPKMVELIRFNGLPHMLGKVEVELDRIIGVLRWVTREMDRRYKLMEEAAARNIAIYNKGRRKSQRLPYIVVIIDELAELMTEFPDQTEPLLTRLAQMARATGIHLVVATQRPSTDVVTGLIKANFPARISFAVPSGTDSRVILDSVGAEDLIGRGDMLFLSSDAAGPLRLQGCYVSDTEMEKVIDFWQNTWTGSTPDDEPAPWQRSLTRAAILNETDPMLEEAIRIVQEEREASASSLQRKLNVGYPRAARIMDLLYKLGIVGEEQAGGRTRSVLIPPDADPIAYIIAKREKK